MRKSLLIVALAVLLLAPAGTSASSKPAVRFATFNASLNRASEGLLRAHLTDPTADTVFVRQAKNVAEVIQRERPDVLLINEFDFDPVARDLFRDNFLEVGQNGAAPIDYPYSFIAPSNTGIPSGFDLDNNGSVGGPNDAFGFGFFPGQFGMVVYSRYPIDLANVRTFQTFLWKDMPGALLPVDPTTGESWYSPEELDAFRLSSKSHWDVPVRIKKATVHFLVSHPTPPVFDGAEDRNGTRNHDEIRFWADYISPESSGYVYDDAGRRGGLGAGELFVIAGDQNSDPLDGDSISGSAQQLIEHPLVNVGETPESDGAKEAARLQGGANDQHLGDPKFDTADFNDSAPGNLRADYVLPSIGLELEDAAVFWPELEDPLSRLTGVFSSEWIAVGGFPTSDHRLTWVDVKVPTVK
jgi:Endonuclease/Exonuclease/phosphatase family